MGEKRVFGRMIQKHDIEANWLKAVNFKPEQGEFIIYDIDENFDYERVKVGDGVHFVNELPFISAGDEQLAEALEDALQAAKDSGEFDGEDGVGIASIEQTTSSTADGGNNVITVTKTDGTKSTFTVKNGNKGADGKTPVKGVDYIDGERGTGILMVTTAPTSYTTATGGKNPIKRMAISTIKTQAGVDKVLVGDLISHSYYLYHVYYLDNTYAYMDVSQTIRGANGTNGKDGSDATVTAENIKNALGYTPADAASAGKFVAHPDQPEDTSVFWVDIDDDSDDGFQEAVNAALAQAKASGAFDGKTPVVGTDYFTALDKAAIVNQVITALPVYAGEVV